METKKRPHYEIASTEIYSRTEGYESDLHLKINFIIEDKSYIASCTYKNDNLLGGYSIKNDDGLDVEDEMVIHLGCTLLDIVDIKYRAEI